MFIIKVLGVIILALLGVSLLIFRSKGNTRPRTKTGTYEAPLSKIERNKKRGVGSLKDYKK